MTNLTNVVSSDSANRNSSTRVASRAFRTLAVALALLTAPLAACSGAASGGPGPGPIADSGAACSSDSDCKGTRVCEEGACVQPRAADAGVGHDSSATPDSAPPPPDTCVANSDCSTGCCHNSVCAAASVCPTPPPPPPPICHNPGLSCTGKSDCCQTGTPVGPYGAVCLSDDDLCHAECYHSYECGSNCCVKLQGVSYGACASSTGHTCL